MTKPAKSSPEVWCVGDLGGNLFLSLTLGTGSEYEFNYRKTGLSRRGWDMWTFWWNNSPSFSLKVACICPFKTLAESRPQRCLEVDVKR